MHALSIGTRLTLRAGTCLVRVGADLTLVDPGGLGDEAALAAALAALGLSPGDVNRVFYTHLHFDHYAGTCFGGQVPEVVIPRVEYDFARRLYALRADRDACRAALGASHHRIAPVFLREFLRLAGDPRYDFDRPELTGRLRLATPGMRLAPGLTCVDLAGHCPGQLGLAARTALGETVIAGDAVLSLEDWQAPDLDHLLIIWERERLLAARARLAGVDCVIPSHGPWFRPADGRLLPATTA